MHAHQFRATAQTLRRLRVIRNKFKLPISSVEYFLHNWHMARARARARARTHAHPIRNGGAIDAAAAAVGEGGGVGAGGCAPNFAIR